MSGRLRIAIVAPIASADVAAHLDGAAQGLPAGYLGATGLGTTTGVATASGASSWAR